jgi:hypothetical protein
LTGEIDLSYNGIKYTGKAINGIIDYCEYETNDGYHGSITSIANGNDLVSIPEIYNGYRTFEFDNMIYLNSMVAKIPSFRFPLAGSITK